MDDILYQKNINTPIIKITGRKLHMLSLELHLSIAAWFPTYCTEQGIDGVDEW